METRKVSLLVSSLFLVIYSASLVRSGSVPSQKLLGVAPEDEKYFSVEQIKCKDGSKKFTISQLNDDFCDCPDGTDEPGTSACPTGKFYCRNAGHVPHAIFSSKVNDGICDCCDGSDEYDGKIKCKNTCWEAGKVARDRLQKKITTFMEGAAIRKREVEQAKVASEKDKAELTRLKNEEKILKGLVEQLKDRKEQIEKAEEKERIQKEKEEKAKKEAEEAISRELEVENKADVTEEEPLSSSDDDKIGLLEDSPAAQDLEEDPAIAAVAVPHDDNAELDKSKENEVKEHAEKKEESADVGHGIDPDAGSKREDASEDTDSLSREELGRMVGSRWTGKKNEDHNAEDAAAKDNDHENDNEAPENVPDEEYNSSYESDTEDDHQYDDDVPEDQLEDVGEESYDDSSSSNKYESDDELDMSDVSSTGYSSWLQKIQKTVRNILQAVNLFQAPVDKSEAEHVRKEYDESSSKLTKIQSRISSLSQKLKHDFGPEKEFYSLYGQCFESKQNKYVYKICPFKEATQVEGYSTTRLGSWENFEESHRIMHFTNGEKCWNGPNRSMKVRLRCGLKNELADVDEPSRCEYVALLSTPLLCREEKLQELRDKLNLMNKEQPQDHDEL